MGIFSHTVGGGGKGRLALEGCTDMAWMVGYAKRFDGRLKDGTLRKP
jgi:hypothetical protein